MGVTSNTVGEKIKNLINKEINEKKVVTQIGINDKIMNKTHKIYEKYCSKGLSFTDCSILAVMQDMKIEHLATTAKEFHGLTNVIDF